MRPVSRSRRRDTEVECHGLPFGHAFSWSRPVSRCSGCSWRTRPRRPRAAATCSWSWHIPTTSRSACAGVIKDARDAGRRVYVAIATNGDTAASGSVGTSYCGASSNSGHYAAQLGLLRDGESIGAMGELGLSWSPSLNNTDIFFLGYPDSKLTSVAGSSGGITSDAHGSAPHLGALRRRRAAADPCNGDFGYLYSGGTHSPLSKGALATDFDRLLSLTHPTDIYTHSTWEGHADHGEVADQVAAAAERSGLALTVHGTMIHPEGSGSCDAVVDFHWPNPSMSSGTNPASRATPTQTFTAPPSPVCASNPSSTSWGSPGAPDERVTVPTSMQDTNLNNNLKWKAIEHYDSQMNCSDWSSPWCGYMHGFVKKDEIFWVQGYNGGGPPPDLTPPAKPAKPTATSLDKSVRITLSPENSEDDLDSYSLQRKKSTDSSWSTVKTGITSWPVTDSGLTNGTAYNYRVIASDTHGNDSTPSDAVTVTPADATPPAKPATPTATAGNGAVTLGLAPLNTDADLQSYTLQRKKSADAAWASVKSGIITWPVTDSGLDNGTGYDYRVLAVDNAGNASTPSNVVTRDARGAARLTGRRRRDDPAAELADHRSDRRARPDRRPHRADDHDPPAGPQDGGRAAGQGAHAEGALLGGLHADRQARHARDVHGQERQEEGQRAPARALGQGLTHRRGRDEDHHQADPRRAQAPGGHGRQAEVPGRRARPGR